MGGKAAHRKGLPPAVAAHDHLPQEVGRVGQRALKRAWKRTPSESQLRLRLFASKKMNNEERARPLHSNAPLK